jgi:transcriptional regulator
MYIPSAFRVEDAARLTAFLQRYSFATLVTFDAGAPFASHLPMLYHPELGPHGTLVSHMARANPQWRHFASGGEALVIFHGPHSYISPSWYETAPAVPTWNYAVVQARGTPAIFTEHERVVALLQATVAKYEAGMAQPWSGELAAEYRDKMIQGIVAFEIPVTRLEGKFKLNQNRSAEDVQGVVKALAQSDDPDGRAVAQMMAAELAARQSG